MKSSSQSEVRMFAVQLLALPAKDRKWVLSQLSDQVRNLLESLMCELSDLGFTERNAAEVISKPESDIQVNTVAERGYQHLLIQNVQKLADYLMYEPEFVREAFIADCRLQSVDQLVEYKWLASRLGVVRVHEPKPLTEKVRHHLIAQLSSRCSSADLPSRQHQADAK